jgi:restriction system protein
LNGGGDPTELKSSHTEIKFEDVIDAHHNRKYQATISHSKLNKFQVISGKNSDVIKQKALAIKAQWDALWDKESKRTFEKKQKEKEKVVKKKDIERNRSIAANKTTKAVKDIESLSCILSQAVKTKQENAWKHFYKIENNFDLSEPEKPIHKLRPGKLKPPKPKSKPAEPDFVEKPIRPPIPPEPMWTDSQYRPHINILDKLFKSRIQKKEREMEDKFQSDNENWVNKKNEIEEQHANRLKQWKQEKKNCESQYQEAVNKWEQNLKDRESQYQEAVKKWDEQNELKYQESLKKWEHLKQEYLQKKNEIQATLENKKREYLDGTNKVVMDFCGKVLDSLERPGFFSQSYTLDYTHSNNMLIIDYQLPSPLNIPRLKEVVYVQSSNQYKETYLSQSRINDLYDSVVYQMALSIPYVIFSANHPDVIKQIVFNGFVRSTDPSTGKKLIACIVSLQVNREELMEINLADVDPKACFRKLKGIGSSQLYSITPIAPILNMSREDKRFIASYDVAYRVDETVNIAAMDWEDFEHLIRELFEKEFSQYGGEVKITQASRDRGVDAIAFDPDPIRGGKVVIQAKRYTNTVGVSAIRDLYGTVINEGATKGIIISTAEYGPDAYEFSKGKPLTLLSGGNLLHLLEKHGHKAKIDLQEAKQLLAEKERQKETIR